MQKGRTDRKLVALRVMTPDGWQDIDIKKVIMFEAAPYPHVVVDEGAGKLRHWFNFPMETVDEPSTIVGA